MDTDSLRELIDRGFSENSKQHEKIEKCLFGNGEIGIVGKVSRQGEIIAELQTLHERVLDKLDGIEEFNAKLSAQISLWKYLISILGVGNIASVIYFFVK
jgi:hypothetical protein